MSMTILISIFMFSILFFKSMNPLSLGLIMIVQTILTAVCLGTMTKTFWIMYLLMLTFIGGMLVLFIYVTSIFPNEKFSFNQKSIFHLFLTLLFMIMTSFILTIFFHETLNLTENMFMLNNENKNLIYSSKMFLSPSSMILIFLVTYLFFTMLVIIKITHFHKGPLRKMN